MNILPSQIESDFASVEEAASYDRWFRAQVEQAFADLRPSIPHDQVMAEMRAIIAEKRKAVGSSIDSSRQNQ